MGNDKLDKGENLRLASPDIRYIDSYLEVCRAFREQNVKYYSLHDPATFHQWRETIIDDFKNEEKGIYNEKKYIPSTTFWLVNDREFIGTGNIRHHLDEKIELLGGHIGYAIRPEKWGMGYATYFLSLLLKEAKKLGLDTVLITCDLPNKASAKVIEKNGGRFYDVNTLIVDGVQRDVCRYLVSTRSKKRRFFNAR